MFKRSFLKMRIKSQLKKNKTARVSTPFHTSKSIGILFTVEDRKKHDDIKNMIKKLETEGKQVKVLCFLPKKKENYEFLFNYFTSDNLNFWGKIESSDVEKFMTENFDFLFNPDTKPNKLIQYILAASKAKCRVGKASENELQLFELMIQPNGNAPSLIEDMYKYTHQLR